MKIYIGPYRDRMTSNIHTSYMNWKYGRNEWDDNTNWFENTLEKIEDVMQWVYNNTINLILDKRKNKKVNIKIHNYDTYSMDHTLAMIILPMLKQLQETKQGSPSVDDIDVPEEMRCNNPESESFWDENEPGNVHERWDWVLNEMIWTFEQKNRDWWEEDYMIEEGEMGESIPVDHEGETLYEMTWKKPYVWNEEGRKAHQERMNNGFRLFGKYFEALWS